MCVCVFIYGCSWACLYMTVCVYIQMSICFYMSMYIYIYIYILVLFSPVKLESGIIPSGEKNHSTMDI